MPPDQHLQRDEQLRVKAVYENAASSYDRAWFA